MEPSIIGYSHFIILFDSKLEWSFLYKYSLDM